MRSLPTVIATVVTAVATVLIGTASYAAQGTLSCPGTAVAGQQFTTEVTIDVGTTPLGAYEMTLTYDPTVLTIAEVAGGNTTEFSDGGRKNGLSCNGGPQANPSSFTTGTTKIVAAQGCNLTGPTGVVSVAMVTFKAVAAASPASIGLAINSLFDATNAAEICMPTGLQVCSAMGCGLSITPAPTTTTSTTSTTTTTRPSTTTTSTSTSTTTQPPTTTTTTRPPATTTSTTSTSTTTRPPTTTAATSTTTTRPPATTTSTTTRPPTTTSTTSTTTTTTQPPATTTSTTTTTTTTQAPTTTVATSTTTTQAPATTTSSSTMTTSPSTTTTTTITPTDQCPQGLGSWKKHPELWPVSSLTLGSQSYAQAELLTMLTTPVTGDASLILARALIPAKLSIANGSDPTPISNTIADADGLLSGFAGKLPYAVAAASATGRAMVNDASLLQRYNSGNLTPTCDTDAASGLIDASGELIAQLEAIQAACAGEEVPLDLRRRLGRTRHLLARASMRTGTRAQVLFRHARNQLRAAARIANQPANAGKVIGECSRLLHRLDH